MRMLLPCLAVLGIALVAPDVSGQTTKKGAMTAGAHRTITGKVSEVQAGESLVTVETVGEMTKKKAAGSQTWVLAVSPQTLLLKAGRNSQYAAVELADLKKGDEIQAVAVLQAEAGNKAHVTWWLVVYPEGTRPAAR